MWDDISPGQIKKSNNNSSSTIDSPSRVSACIWWLRARGASAEQGAVQEQPAMLPRSSVNTEVGVEGGGERVAVVGGDGDKEVDRRVGYDGS